MGRVLVRKVEKKKQVSHSFRAGVPRASELGEGTLGSVKQMSGYSSDDVELVIMPYMNKANIYGS